jgi:NAD(P)-dependent dehydrogenase (short-subunit alcohol dehydrogenase family)
MGRLDGRVAIVTGGAKGIGRHYSLALAAEGARLMIADIADGVEVADTITRAHGDNSVANAITDVSDEAAVKALVAKTMERFGKIDILVNNAAVYATLPEAKCTEIDVAVWDRVMAVNLRGMFLCCRAAFPAMQAQKRGKIVNISSSRVWEGAPNRLHYTTSKAGVIGLTRALAREVGEFGVTVNALTPGMTQSETQVASSSGNYLATRVAGRAIERVQVPADLVGAVMFLSSPASDFMTGQTVNVDGGKSMH